MPKLILKFEAAVIKEIPMLSSSLTIGRKSDNDFVIDHPAVSSHHCRISRQGDTYFVEDLNSTNGTLVNDKKIIKAGVHNNDTITIAKHTITFLDDRANAPAATNAQVAVPASAPPPAPVPPPAQIAETPAPPKPSPSNPEMVMDATGEMTAKKKGFDRTGGLRVTEGAVDSKTDFLLTDTSTYMGKSDRATIKTKAGMMAPEMGALISKKLTGGYVLIAMKAGYPKVNGQSVDKECPLK